MIDTKKVKDRRELRFKTLDAAIRDAETLVAADAEGRLNKIGNWTLGEAIYHLAFWADAPFDGYPPELKPGWFIRTVMKFMKGQILNKGMMAGVKVPNTERGTYGIEDLPPSEALERLRSAFTRLDQNCPADPNPLFGKMDHTEWRQLNLRHAELHLSFFSEQS